MDWPALDPDGREWGAEAGVLTAIVTPLRAQSFDAEGGITVYVRNAGTFVSAVVTGGDPSARYALALDIYTIARQWNFVFNDQTRNLRRSMRVLGTVRSNWNAFRAGGASAPYGGYVEAIKPFTEIATRIAVNRMEP